MKDHIGRRKTSPSGGGLAEVFGFAAGTLRGWALILFRLLIRIFSPRGEVMDEIKYKEVNGTSYHIDTCDNVVRILESMRMSQIFLSTISVAMEAPGFWTIASSVFAPQRETGFCTNTPSITLRGKTMLREKIRPNKKSGLGETL